MNYGLDVSRAIHLFNRKRLMYIIAVKEDKQLNETL